MTNENGSKFYFKVEDIQELLDQGATHFVINAETGELGTSSNIAAEGFDAAATSKGTKPGCPWPCGGSSTTITPQSLDQARKALGGSTSYQIE
jgi:hypothetical protein